jgi:hypothetical protein
MIEPPFSTLNEAHLSNNLKEAHPISKIHLEWLIVWEDHLEEPGD